MATNKKITQLDELTPATWADDDVIAIVDISAQETKKIQLSTFRGAVTGVSSLNASTPLTVDSATGDVTIGVAINGGGTINAVFDEDNMASNSPTALATQQSIKAYVDSQVGTVDTLAEILSNGNTSGGTNIVVSSGDVITTNTVNETTAASGVTIDGVLVKDGQVDGRDVSVDGTKLDTVETNADVTDTANVTAAGALMDSELTNITAVKALNQGVATTDTPTFAGVVTAGNVDGRDVSVDGAKLDGIEAGADVTDTANVTAAGALMDSELTSIAAVKALDQGVATTDSPSFAGLTATTADINGGTIDGAVIGGASAAAGTFTTLSMSGTLSGPANTTIQNSGGGGSYVELVANSQKQFDAYTIGGTTANWIRATGGQTGNAAVLSSESDTDTNVDLTLTPKGSGAVNVTGNLLASNATGPALMNEVASATNPTIIPNRVATTSGFGANGAGNTIYGIGSGAEHFRFGNGAMHISVGLTVAASIAGQNAVNRFGPSSGDADIRVLAGNAATSRIYFGDSDSETVGAVAYYHSANVFEYNQTLQMANAAGPALLNEAATTTNPTLVHNRADLTTGWGGASGIMDAVVGGVRVGSFDGGGYVTRQQGSAAAPSIQMNEDSTGFFTVGAGASIGVTLAGTQSLAISATDLSMNNAAGPALLNEAATSTNPTLVPNRADTDTGIAWSSANVLSFVTGGTARFTIGGSIDAANSTGPAILNEAASSTNPTLAPNKNDPDTGIGSGGADNLDLIAGGSQKLTINVNTGTTGGAGSAGAGNQYVELIIAGSRYKLLHDGTI
jgi:hypothetical protein